MGGGEKQKHLWRPFLRLRPRAKNAFIFLNNNSKNKPKMGF